MVRLVAHAQQTTTRVDRLLLLLQLQAQGSIQGETLEGRFAYMSESARAALAAALASATNSAGTCLNSF
jgi:hypothetical protein